jgi:hypothetical protein
MFGRDWCLEEGDVGDEDGEDNTMLFKVLLVLLRRDVNDKLMLLLFTCLENDLYLVLTLLILFILILLLLNLNGKYCE